MATIGRHTDVRYEHSDMDVRKVSYVGLGVLLGVLLVVGIVHLVFSHFARLKIQESPLPLPIAAHGRPLPPQPTLQASPHHDLVALTSAAQYELHSYHWADRSNGIVVIPIDRAIDLTAQRGIPKSPPPASQFEYYRPKEGDRLTGFEERKVPQP